MNLSSIIFSLYKKYKIIYDDLLKTKLAFSHGHHNPCLKKRRENAVTLRPLFGDQCLFLSIHPFHSKSKPK